MNALMKEIASNFAAIVQKFDSEAMPRHVGLLLDWSIREVPSQEIETSLRVVDKRYLSGDGSIRCYEEARRRLKHNWILNHRKQSI